MRIIEKYILKSFLAPFIYCCIIFTFLYIIIDLFEHLDELLKNSVPLNILSIYYINSIPGILVKIIPLAILLSIIYTLSKLNKKNEITTMRASGINLFKIFKPFLIIGIFISVFTLVINLNLVPVANRNSKQIKSTYIESDFSKKKKNIYKNVTLYGHSNRIIFAKEFNYKTKTLEGVIILQQYKTNLIQRITADKAVWENKQWKLLESMTYYMEPNGKTIMHPTFASKEYVDLEIQPNDFLHNYTEEKFMKYNELKRHIEKFQGASNKITRRLLIELYNKISFPFVSIIMVLIAVPFALNIGHSGTFMSIALCIGIGFCYYAINAISLALGNAGILPPFISAWLTNIIFASVGITLFSIIKD